MPPEMRRGSTFHVEDYWKKSFPGWMQWPLTTVGGIRGADDIPRMVEAAKRAQINLLRISPQFDYLAEPTVARPASWWYDLSNWTGSNHETGLSWQKTADGVTNDLDAWINAMAAAGIQIMMMVGYGALWLPYAAHGPNGEPDASETAASPISGLNNQQMMAKYFAAYAGELSRRYGSAVLWWEVWNEWTFFSSGSFNGFWDWNTDAYRQLFVEASYQIKKHTPDAMVGWNSEQMDKIAGASTWNGTAADQFFNKDASYASLLEPGLTNLRTVDLCDLVIPHAYPDRSSSGQIPENYLEASGVRQQLVNRIVVANNAIRARWNPPGVNGGVAGSNNNNGGAGHESGLAGSTTRGNKVFIIGEFGWYSIPTGGTLSARWVTEDKQAALLQRLILETLTAPVGTSATTDDPLLVGAMQYDMVNDGTAPNTNSEHTERMYGLFEHSSTGTGPGTDNLNVDGTYKIKPSGQAFANLKRMLARTNYVAPTRTVTTSSSTDGWIKLEFPANAQGEKLWIVWAYKTNAQYGDINALSYSATIDVGSRNVQSLDMKGLTATNLTKTGNNVTVNVTERPLFIIDQGIVLTPPSAPAGLAASVISNTRIDLSWSDVAAESGYVLQRRIVGNPVGFADLIDLPAGSVAYSDTAAQADTDYEYRLRAYNTNGDSPYSSTVPASTVVQPPAAPTTAQATAIGPTAVTITWEDNATTETAFDVERGLGATPSSWTVLTTTLPPGSEDYTDNTAAANTQYTYRVRARNAGGGSAYAQTNAVTTPPNPPSAPSTPTASQPSPTSPTIRLAWTPGTGQTNQEVQRRVGAGAWSNISGALAANVTAFDDTGATAGVTYQYQIRAYNSGGSVLSGIVSATPTIGGPPTAPNNVNASAVGPGSVTVTWADLATTETAYEIERGLGSSPASWTILSTNLPAGSNSYADATATPNTAYTYRVRARNNDGTSAYATSNVVTTPPSPPAAPASLTATPASSSAITLSWPAVSGATGYRVERQGPGESAMSEIGAVGAVTTYADSGLSPSSVYSYRVRAFNTGGNGAYSPSANATTQAAPVAAPTNLRLSGTLTPTTAPLAWDDNASTESGYRLQRRTLPSGVFADLPITLGTNTTAYTDPGLAPNTSYEYRVRATATGGDSGYSNILTVTTPLAPPAAPTNLRVTEVASNRVVIAWADNAGDETNYQVERKGPSDASFILIAQPGSNATSYADISVSSSTQYQYRVRAINGAGASAYATPVVATTAQATAGGAVAGVVSVRDPATGTILATLPYAPYPIVWEDGEPIAYGLDGAPELPLYAVVNLEYAFTEQRILTMLLALPTDRELDFFLKVQTNSTNEVRWAWVRGWLMRPSTTRGRNRRDWVQEPWRLVSAREVG